VFKNSIVNQSEDLSIHMKK